MASEFPFPEQTPPYFHKDYTEVYRWGGGGGSVNQGDTIHLAFTVRPKGEQKYYDLGYGIYYPDEDVFRSYGEFVSDRGAFYDYNLTQRRNHWAGRGAELKGPLWTFGGPLSKYAKDYFSIQYLTEPFVSSRTKAYGPITWYGFKPIHIYESDYFDSRDLFLGIPSEQSRDVGLAYASLPADASYNSVDDMPLYLYVAPIIAPEPMELDYWELATPEGTIPGKRYSYFIRPPQDESFLAIAHLKPATQATVKIQPDPNSVYSFAVTVYGSYKDGPADIKTEETVSGDTKELKVTKGCRVQVKAPNENPCFPLLGWRVTIKQRQEESPDEIEETQFIPYGFIGNGAYGTLNIIIHGDTTITPVIAPASLIYDPSTGGLVYSPKIDNQLVFLSLTY